ncbi:MAG: Ig-like domain-containing protein, partial [Dehalococcoidales bacterium]
GVSSCPVAIGPEYIFRNSISGLHYRNEAGDNEAFKLGDSSTGPIYFYHNSIYGTEASDGAAATNGGLANVISRNNIYHVGWYVLEFGHYSDAVNCNFDYDNLYTTSTERFVKWGEAKYASISAFASGAGQETHGMSISATNEFVAAAGGDLSLMADSQFIDKGEVLPGFNDANSPWPYSGAAPDLGAFEFASGGSSSNNAPVAANNNYSMVGNTSLTIAVPGILANDTDEDGDTLMAVLAGIPSHGSLILNSDGSFNYTPTFRYSGTDTFTYKAYDGKSYSLSATVTITVNPAPNVAAVAANDAFTTNKDTALVVSAPGVLTNDSDDNGDALTTILVSNVSHGALALNSSGAFVYNPASGYTGTDSFTYKANDGNTNSNTATVTITIFASSSSGTFGLSSGDSSWEQDASVLDAMRFQNTAGTGTLYKLEVLVSDSSPTGKIRMGVYADNNGVPGALLLDAGEVNAANGWVAISGLNLPVTKNAYYWLSFIMDSPNTVKDQNNQVVCHYWTWPEFNYGPLPSEFNLSHCDANGSPYVMRATVNIGDVSSPGTPTPPVNTTPVAFNDAYSTNKDTTLTVSAPGVLANDSDANGDTLTAALTGGVSHGTLSFNSNGSFTYSPASGYTGTDSFTYQAYDGTVNSNTATVTITINAPANTAPVAVNDTYNTNKDTALIVPAPGVLANDTDANGDTLTTVLAGNVSHGTLALNSSGAFVYNPASGYTGTDSFTYKANDGKVNSNTVTVTITVNTPSNTAPVAVNDTYTLVESGVLTISIPGVLANDNDANGDTMTAVLITDVSHCSLTLNSDGSFVYTSSEGYVGTDSFTYKVSDGSATSNTGTVTLIITAAPVTPPAGGVTFGLDAGNSYWSQRSGVLDTMRFMNTSGTGTLNKLEVLFTDTTPNGKVRLGVYADNNGKPGALLLDAGEVNAANGWVSISGLNLPVTQNTYYWLAFTMQSGNDVSDMIGQSGDSHYWITSSYGSLPSQFNLSWASKNDIPYVMRATVNVGSGGGEIIVNTPPSAVNDAYSTNQNTALAVATPGVLVNDTDTNGDILSAVLVTNVSHGTLVLNANGAVTYIPASGYTGTDSFTYRANDGENNSNTATVTIIVSATPVTPPAGGVTFGLNSGNNYWSQRSGILDVMRFKNTAGTGVLTKLELLFTDTTPTGKVRMGVYADNYGKPGALLLDAGEVSVTNGWVSISGLNLPVTQNTYYWLAFTMDSANDVSTMTGQASNSHYWITSSYGTLPSQFNTRVASRNSVPYVMRATVEIR